MNRRLVFLLIAVLLLGTAVAAAALAAGSPTEGSPTTGSTGPPASGQTTRTAGSVDTLLAQRIDLECLTGEGTTGAPAVVCYKHTAPRGSVYVEFEPTLMRVMRIRGGGLVEVARYRR